MCTLYFDCEKGAAGDMICAALYELVSDKKKMLDKLNGMGIQGVKFEPEKTEKYGIDGFSMSVKIHGTEEGEEHHHAHDEEGHHHHHHHHHMTMPEIRQIVDGMEVSDRVKAAVMDIYGLIADAEAQAHGCPVTEVHFHEVGALDAIADVTAACLLLEELKPDKIVASRLRVGNGTVECAHGVLPVPAPATANLLQEIPYEAGDINGEICTPTGAALLRYFVSVFGVKVEEAEIEKKGVGLGKKTFDRPSYFAAGLLKAA